jgi:ABC-type transporter Mla subunit MlaD
MAPNNRLDGRTVVRVDPDRGQGRKAVTERLRSSTSVLHKRWAELEDEHHELALAIDAAGARRTDLAPMRERQVRLLLDINSLVAEIRDAPAATLEDFCALLDVALEHEVDLACDIAFYGPADFPMIRRLLRALARNVPEFEFNSLRRWLSPGQLEQLMGGATRLESAGKDAAPAEPSAFVTAIRANTPHRGG